MLAIIPGALLSQKFYLFSSLFLYCIFQLYIPKFQVCSVLRAVIVIVKERSCAMPTLNILINNKIIKQTVKPAVHVQNMSVLNMYNLR